MPVVLELGLSMKEGCALRLAKAYFTSVKIVYEQPVYEDCICEHCLDVQFCLLLQR